MAHVLPPEVLAACFRFLPLSDLITASHISRDWRATALAFPDLWSIIHIDDEIPQPLLAAVLGRSGNVPLIIEISDDPDFALAPVLAPYVHRIRRFIAVVEAGLNLKVFNRPAPLLEQLDLHCTDAIPEDFLGGCAGALQRLTLIGLELPASGVCPGLSTVTDLWVTYTHHDEIDYGPLDRLFELCPLLEKLHLDGLTNDVALPSGPAPRTLHTLTLTTIDPELCLLSVLHDWKPDSLTNTTLKFSRKCLTPTSGEALDELLSGVVELEIFFTREMLSAFRVVDSHQRTLNLTVLDAEVVRHVMPLIEPLLKLGEGTLRTLGILDANLSRLPLPIPSLETLTLGVCYYAGVTKGFHWSRLKRLADLGPGRRSIMMEVRSRKRLGESDVREMMESLAFVGDNAEGDIEMKIVMHRTAQDAVRQVGFAAPRRIGRLAVVEIKFGKYWPDWEF